MKKKRTVQPKLSNLRVVAWVVFLAAMCVTVSARANPTSSNHASARPSGTVQEAWVARYNGPANDIDDARAIAVDAAGNVYVTGGSYKDPDYFYHTIKYNSAGQQQWVASYLAGGYAEAIVLDSAGNVYVTGSSYVTIKYNSSGQQQWVVDYHGPGDSSDLANALAVDGSGNVYVTGGAFNPNEGNAYVTIKWNSVGQQQWVARYSDPNAQHNYSYAIAVNSLGDVCITGSAATIKYSSAGQEQWVAPSSNLYALALDSSDNVYVTGQGITIKYDSAGQQQWLSGFPGYAAYAIAIDGSGFVYATGVGGNTDYATVKYDSGGQQEWAVYYNGPGNDQDIAKAIAIDTLGNVYVTGFTSIVDGTNWDYATIKYDSAGQQQWLVRYNGPGNSIDAANALALDASGNVYVTGYSVGQNTGEDYATIKYVQGLTPTPTSTSTATATATVTATPTATPTPTATLSPSATPTATATATPTATSIPSTTPRVTPTPRDRLTPRARPTPPPHITPVPPPPSPRPTPAPRPSP